MGLIECFFNFSYHYVNLVRGSSELILDLLAECVSSFMLLFNLFQFLFTVIPIRYRIVCRGTVSDGMQFVHVLKQKGDQTNTEEQE